MSSKMKKQPIPEDFELSDEEPTTIKLNEEQKLTSKFITFDCPLCQGEIATEKWNWNQPQRDKMQVQPL